MDSRWQNLSDPLFHHAATRPDAPALIEGSESLSYGALAALVVQATIYLHELGIGQGERIGVALTNSIDHVIVQYALFRIGATLVELPAEDAPDRLAATARQYGIRTIFTEAHTPEPPGIKRIRVDLAWRSRLAGKSGDYRSLAPAEALQFIALTTGSTGIPSGWVMTHANSLRHTAFRVWRYPEAEASRPPAYLLTVLPMRFAWTIGSVLVHFAVGGAVVLLPEMAKIDDLLRAVMAWGDAIVTVPPNACRHFLRAAPETGLLLPKLRRLEIGGQPLYSDEKRAVLARVTPNLHEIYGTTAGGFITGLSGTDLIAHPDSVGRAQPGIEVAIVDAAGQPVPAGIDGEIRSRPLKAERRCSESGGDAASGGERIVDGWCYTGDIGHLDAEGYLYLKGRGTDLIRRNGVEIFALEIEAALVTHPAVADAAVVGLQSASGNDQVVAFIVKRGALAHDDIARHCRERLKPHQFPDRVFYAEELPRLPGGKVNRIRLQEIAADHLKQAQ
jgi:acyl-coenzyme A synthetase/AMP-(fatty) acid ligase